MYAGAICSIEQTTYSSVYRNVKWKQPRRRLRFRLLLPMALTAFGLIFGIMVHADAADNGQQDAVVVHNGSPVAGSSSVVADSNVVYAAKGDTLWGIAQSHKPVGADLRTYVDRMAKLNHIQGAFIHEGQPIILP